MSNATAPTPRQLSYLRALAARTATTFTNPETRVQASREIERMRRLERVDPRIERAGREPAAQYATAVVEDEIDGYGSSAHWRTAAPARAPRPPVERTRRILGRYCVSAGERVLYATRAEDRLRILDTPARTAGGRSYPVEELDASEPEDALQALIADYLERARALDQIPMAEPALTQLLGIAPGDV